MNPEDLLELLLKHEGAVAFGICRAEPVEKENWEIFEDWLQKGHHAGMAYMENYPELRRDPRKLLEEARTIISVAFNYRQFNPYKGIATYALGQDYHKVLRKRLKKVVSGMQDKWGGNWRICIDSAPVLERYWAQKSGVGQRNPNHGNIMVEGVGSMVFLAELITTLELKQHSVNFVSENTGKNEEKAEYPQTVGCPTGALQPGGRVDSRRCINYLTIEHRGEWTPEEKRMVGKAVFGCDLCQLCSPENSTVSLPVLPEFKPLEGLAEFLEGKEGIFQIGKSPLSRSEKLFKRR